MMPSSSEVTAAAAAAIVFHARRGDLDEVRRLVGKGVSVDSKSEGGRTALHFACLHGCEPLVTYLIEQRANVNACTNYGGETPLMLAATRGHLGIIRLLLAAGAFATLTDTFGGNETARGKAERYNHPAVVAELDADAMKLAMMAIVSHARRGDLDEVRRLVEEGVSVETKGVGENTALHEGCWNGHEPVVKYLIGQRANLNARCRGGRTPLMNAACNGHLGILRLLLAAGADATLKNHKGGTAREEAARDNHPAVVAELDAHAEAKARRESEQAEAAGITVEELRRREAAEAALRSLAAQDISALRGAIGEARAAGADVALLREANALFETAEAVKARREAEEKAQGGGCEECTAGARSAKRLMPSWMDDAIVEAARWGDLDEVRRLVAEGVSVETKGVHDGTALHWACYEGHEPVVTYLIEQRANVNARNIGGDTPLMEAATCGHLGILRLLLAAGADATLKGSSGETARRQAACCFNRAVVAELDAHAARGAASSSWDDEDFDERHPNRLATPTGDFDDVEITDEERRALRAEIGDEDDEDDEFEQGVVGSRAPSTGSKRAASSGSPGSAAKKLKNNN